MVRAPAKPVPKAPKTMLSNIVHVLHEHERKVRTVRITMFAYRDTIVMVVFMW